MNFLRIFFTGFFTRHLGTKSLSLLLSVTVFLLVHQSLTAEAEIDDVTLVFELADDLSGNWVVLRGEVILPGLRIKGLQTVVDGKLKELQASNHRLRVVVNERFFNNYRDAARIPVTARLLRERVLFGPDLEILGLPADRAAVLDQLDTKKLPIRLAPGQEEKIKLSEGSPFIADSPDGRLDIRFSVPEVEVRGPTTSLRNLKATSLLVDIADINDFLSRYVSRGETETIARSDLVLGIDLDASGLHEEHRPHLRILKPFPMSFDAFEQQLQVIFKIREQPMPMTLTVAVRVVNTNPPVEFGSSFGVLVTQDEFDNGVVESLPVEVPRSLANRKELLSNIALFLDFANAVEVADLLEVPAYLGPKSPVSAEDEARIRRIVIKSPTRVAKFKGKQ